MDVTIRVKRQDPEAGDERRLPYWQEYPVTIADNATVLDALIQIREDDDGTLSLRCSCRSAICGSCAVRINGHAGLACKTIANTVVQDGVITVEPAGVMPVVKDLVVNFDLFWEKIERRRTVPEAHGTGAGRRVHRVQRRDAAPVGRHRLHHVRRVRVGLHRAGG